MCALLYILIFGSTQKRNKHLLVNKKTILSGIKSKQSLLHKIYICSIYYSLLIIFPSQPQCHMHMFIHSYVHPLTPASQHVFSSIQKQWLSRPFCTAVQMNWSAGQKTRPKHVFSLFCLLITYTHSYFSHTVFVLSVCVSELHVCVCFAVVTRGFVSGTGVSHSRHSIQTNSVCLGNNWAQP